MHRIINLSVNITRLLIVFLITLSLSSNVFSQVIITPGTTVSTAGNVQVVMADLDLNNSGTINASASTFVFTGTGNNAISGTGTATGFNNLTINKPVGKMLTLNNPVNVTGHVNFISGNIELNKQVMSLGSTGLFVGEKDNSRATGIHGGSITVNALLNAPDAVNTGNLGAVITSTANMGTVYITRRHQPADIATAGSKSIYRSFDIVAANNTSLNATLTIKYFDDELNGINENNLTQFQTSANNNYVNMNYSNRSNSLGYVTQTGYDHLYRYTLSSFAGLQPVNIPGIINSDGKLAKNILTGFEKNPAFKVIPNPVVDIANVESYEITSGKGMLLLFNAGGQQVMLQPVMLLKGINQYKLNMQQLAPGTYNLVLVRSGVTNQVTKIVKR